MTGILTLADAGALSSILSAAQRNATVARIMPRSGDLIIGQARYIGQYARDGLRDFRAEATADVRDLRLHVRTGSSELHWLVSELAAEYHAGTFVADFGLSAWQAAVVPTPEPQIALLRREVPEAFVPPF